MSGRGRGRRGGKAKVSVSREFLKRSAAEAGLDDRHLRVLTDITHPTLFADFLWHSEGGYWDEDEHQQQQQRNHLPPKLETTTDVIKPEDPTSSSSVSVAAAGNSKSSQSSKRSAGTIYWMNRQRELTTRMQASTHYIRCGDDPFSLLALNQQPYSAFTNSTCSRTPDREFLTSLSKLGSDERYFPMELLAPHKLAQQKTSLARTTSSSGGTDGDVLVRTTTDMGVGGGDIPDAGEENNKTNEEEGEGEEEEAEQFNIEEEEEGEDYTTNYYNTDDESDGGDGGEPTF
jgi:hypothetical protein